MPISFIPSQIGSEDSQPIAYTENPLHLLWSDLTLFWRQKTRVGGIFFPLRPFELDPFDELYPSRLNLVAIIIHMVLLVLQSAFLISIPFCFFMPVVSLGLFVGYVSIFLAVNSMICRILNGDQLQLTSEMGVTDSSKHRDEYWIYFNGVSIGRDWLQANIDRLSMTFGRRITGVHNPTFGILFDLVQCLIQRNLCYSTMDVRDAYKKIKKALLDPGNNKVIFILHSQGGIEGGMVIDWLLAEVPQDRMQRLEVYTFGNAANHFNNPHLTLSSLVSSKSSGKPTRSRKAIRYVEHYANTGDFVAQFGVLAFTQVSNRFMGRVFQSPKSGHLLNQHYLHQMFPLGSDGKAKETNDFMEMEVTMEQKDLMDDERESIFASLTCSSDPESAVAFVGDCNSPSSSLNLSSPDASFSNEQALRKLRVKDFSRLWAYRNGRSPDDKATLPTRVTL